MATFKIENNTGELREQLLLEGVPPGSLRMDFTSVSKLWSSILSTVSSNTSNGPCSTVWEGGWEPVLVVLTVLGVDRESLHQGRM